VRIRDPVTMTSETSALCAYAGVNPALAAIAARAKEA
jgi:hypothetical protein